MADASTETLEGRLLAHRKILALLLAEAVERAGMADVTEMLGARVVVQDHQEDPGAVPTEGLAIEAAVADEVRRLSELARIYAAETGVRRGPAGGAVEGSA